MIKTYLEKYKIFLIPVLIIIFVVIFSYFLIIPKIRETRLIYEENRVLQQKAVSLEAKAKKLKELKNSALITDFEKMEMILPSEKNITYLISSLTKLELDNSINYNSIILNPGTIKENEKPKPIKQVKIEGDSESPQETSSPPPAPIVDINGQTIKFSLSFIVNSDSSLDFVDKLYEATPIYSVSQADYSISENSNNLSLEIETYYLKLPDTLGSIDTPLTDITEKQKKIIADLSQFKIIDEKPVDYVVISSPSGAVKITNNIFKM